MQSFMQSWIENLKARRFLRTSRYRTMLEDMPAGVYDCWRRISGFEFPGIPADRLFFLKAAEGLMMFFDCASVSDEASALPSKAADSVWHAWLRYSSVSLDQFCLRHFGKTVPHLSSAQMPGDMSNALAATLVRARMLEGHSAHSPRLPQLFSLDRRLTMPEGYAYHMRRDEIGYQPMNQAGLPGGTSVYPDSLSSAGLYSLGLIKQSEYDEIRWQQARQNQQSDQSNHSDSGGYDTSFFSDQSGDDHRHTNHHSNHHSSHSSSHSSGHSDTRTHFINRKECEQGDSGGSAKRVAKQRLVPLQAAQRSNAPESPVPGGFASSRALDGVGLVINSTAIDCLVRLASPRDEANASPSYL